MVHIVRSDIICLYIVNLGTIVKIEQVLICELICFRRISSIVNNVHLPNFKLQCCIYDPLC